MVSLFAIMRLGPSRSMPALDLRVIVINDAVFASYWLSSDFRRSTRRCAATGAAVAPVWRGNSILHRTKDTTRVSSPSVEDFPRTWSRRSTRPSASCRCPCGEELLLPLPADIRYDSLCQPLSRRGTCTGQSRTRSLCRDGQAVSPERKVITRRASITFFQPSPGSQ